MNGTLFRLVVLISCAHALVHVYELAFPSVETLVAANGLPSPDLIAVGQNLDIPALGGDVIEARSHVVRRGNSLTQISRIYGVSVDELRSHNELRSSVIHPGQVLVIP